MRRAPTPLLAVTLLAVVRLAAAQGVDEERHRLAAASFQQAQAAFGRRDFAAAAAAFEQAARNEPHPSPLLNAAEAWELAGDPVRAAEDCDQALALPVVAEPFRTEAEQRLARLAPSIATLDVGGPATVRMQVDGGAEGPVPARRRLTPGRHLVAWTDPATSRSGTNPVELSAGQTLALEIGQPPPPTVAPRPARRTDTLAPMQPRPSRGVPTATWIAFGLGAVAGGVVAVSGTLTLRAKDAFNDKPTADHADAFDRDKLITNVALVACGAALATGVIVWIASRSSGSAPRPPAASALIAGARF